MKTIFITGATDGIGKELALLYSRPGITLGLCGRSHLKLVGIQRECEKRGAAIWIYSFDLKSQVKVFEETARDFQSKVGKIDLVIANAGIGDSGYKKYSTEYLLEFYDINTIGTIKTLSAFIPIMQHQKSGQMAVVSSMYCFFNAHIYASSKISANIFVEMMSRNIKEIIFTTVYLGVVDTKMISTHKDQAISPFQAAQIIKKAVNKKKRIAYSSYFFYLKVKIWNLFKRR